MEVTTSACGATLTLPLDTMNGWDPATMLGREMRCACGAVLWNGGDDTRFLREVFKARATAGLPVRLSISR